MISRRNLLITSAAAATGAMLGTKPGEARATDAMNAIGGDYVTVPEDVQSTVQIGDAPLAPGVPGRDYTPVIAPNLPTLPWSLVDGAKVFHLVAEEMWHEFAPGLRALSWGYNGHVPGPLIEAVEGDHVRIYVTNRLKTGTTVHWHGFLLPNGMDGVSGLTQKVIRPGETFKYEFTLRQFGTQLYHSHHDEMTQMGMGLIGMFVIHPRKEFMARPARDFAILLNEQHVTVGTYRPDPAEMSDFNVLTFNGKVFPGTDPLVAKHGDFVRIRIGNLSPISHHPIHLHGHSFRVVETDGGRIPDSAQWPETTMLVNVGTSRVMEFTADAPGDWALHCHMTHHTMNQMGHRSPNMIGVEPGGLDQRVRALLPGYMTMGTTGMGEMGAMHMPVPENSIPMAGAYGPFGYITMGGMFTVLKVREHITSYDDPGWYSHPPDTVAQAATADDLRRDGIEV